jgi:NADH-quinone oxidoreductase subunit J
MQGLDAIIDPIVLYVGLAVGALGVLVALPRRGVNPQLLGLLLAAIGFGGVVGVLAFRAAASAESVSVFFYIFAAIALLSALRVVTHQRPVYSALYFILTILSSSALYLLVGSEFMAFALIIIYAGAILITYLFVIMLATQAPSEQDVGIMSPYDAYAREPVAATATGFVLLAVLSGMFATGVPGLAATGDAGAGQREDPALLAELPGRVVRGLDGRGAFGVFVKPTRGALVDGEGPVELDVSAGEVTLVLREGGVETLERRLAAGDARLGELLGLERVDDEVAASAVAGLADGQPVSLVLPKDVRPTNLDGVGWTLVAGHPVTLELAGVILLMALLGAVVLARKQIELGEEEKEAVARIAAEGGTLPGPTSGEDEPFAAGADPNIDTAPGYVDRPLGGAHGGGEVGDSR